MLRVICVLKSGGTFDEKYAHFIKHELEGALSIPYELVFYTDIELEGFNTKPLYNNLKGWWSKIEIFHFEKGPCIYLDLDTFLLGSIDKLAETVMKEEGFWMLRAFNKEKTWASGVMAWKGNFDFLYWKFPFMYYTPRFWDQDYIVRKLVGHEVEIKAVQDYLPGVYSFKKQRGELPYDASIMCCHGRLNKPHLITHGWALERWRAQCHL